jgi:hypothetical protein
VATIRFQLFRLSLLLHEQMSLFDHEVISREEYLRGIFRKNISLIIMEIGSITSRI